MLRFQVKCQVVNSQQCHETILYDLTRDVCVCWYFLLTCTHRHTRRHTRAATHTETQSRQRCRKWLADCLLFCKHVDVHTANQRAGLSHTDVQTCLCVLCISQTHMGRHTHVMHVQKCILYVCLQTSPPLSPSFSFCMHTNSHSKQLVTICSQKSHPVTKK